MTHEELLAICDNYSFKDSAEPVKALRAVVELHQPKGNFADTYINGEPNSPYCPECVDPDVYPCPTIQVIEKELQ